MAESASNERIGDLELARARRLEASRSLSMNERLARVHRLCKQMTAIKGAAARAH